MAAVPNCRLFLPNKSGVRDFRVGGLFPKGEKNNKKRLDGFGCDENVAAPQWRCDYSMSRYVNRGSTRALSPKHNNVKTERRVR